MVVEISWSRTPDSNPILLAEKYHAKLKPTYFQYPKNTAQLIFIIFVFN